MKTPTHRWPLVILLAIAACLPFLHYQNLNAQAQPLPPRHRWEYASLMTSARQSKWISADLRHTEDGDQGWELTAIDGGEGPHQYLFKRPLP